MTPDFKDLVQIYQQRALESLSDEDLAHAKRYRLAAELEAQHLRDVHTLECWNKAITDLQAERDVAKHNCEAQERENERLQKDADRYRWLRMHTDWFDWDIVVQPHLPADHPAHDYFEVKIDCAIDFVMGDLK